MRQLTADVVKRRSKRVRASIVIGRKRTIACFAGCKCQHGIAGRCVAVDGDTAETGFVGSR